MVLGGVRREKGSADLTTVGSATAVGVFGWLVAHTLNFWIVAHSQHVVLGHTSRQLWQVTTTATMVVGMLAVAALLSVVRGCGPAAPRHRRGRTIQVAVGLSTAAFLVADTIEHAVLGLDSTPAVGVLLGALVHASFGAGTSLYWLQFVAELQVAARWLLPWLLPEPSPVRPVARHRWHPDRFWWASAPACRAPPAC